MELHFENNGFGYYGHWIRPHLNHWMWIWIRTAGIAHLKLDTASAIKWSIPLVRPSWRQKVGWIFYLKINQNITTYNLATTLFNDWSLFEWGKKEISLPLFASVDCHNFNHHIYDSG